MPTFRVNFFFKRTVTCLFEAEAESDVDDFMVENSSFNPLEDAPETIENDETGIDIEAEAGDYEIIEDNSVTANWVITPSLELEELD